MRRVLIVFVLFISSWNVPDIVASEFRDGLVSFLQKYSSAHGVDVELLDVDTRSNPKGMVHWRMPKFNGYPERLSVIAEQRVDGHIRRWYVPVRLRWRSTVVVSRKAIKRGHVLTADDLTIQKTDVTNRTGLVRSVNDVVAARLVRSVEAGAPLSVHMVAQPPLVHRGDWVTVVAQSGNLKVTSRGKAMKDARKGELLTVRSYDKKRYIQARVLSSSLVSVSLGG